MATGSRSSKRKSSPSLKKMRRTNKDRSKKRSKLGRGKSKKVSPDSYSEDESLSVASSMSYSSTDSDRGRSRSRSRKDNTSKRRKKSRARSESSEDAGFERKNKRSKKSKDRDAKKKRVKRKRRREPSVSCSTCESSDASEGESGRSEKRRGRRRRDSDEDGGMRGDRPRSDSSCRLELDGGDGSFRSEVQRPEESNPRRLRSIIIFAKEREEADKELLDRDGHKEEIIYDHDDYPSPKSNASNDGDAKREPCTARAGSLEDQLGEIVASKVGITELSEKCDLGVNVRLLEEPKTNLSSTDAGSNSIDLEAVLRQKALENLMKFKGGLRATAKKPVSSKSSNEGEVKQSSSLKDDVECLKKDQVGSAGGIDSSSVPRKNISTVGQLSSGTIQKCSSLKRPSVESSQTLPQELIVVNSAEEGRPDDVDRLKGREVGMLPLKEKHHRLIKLVKQAVPTQQLPVPNTPFTESLPLPSKDANALTDSIHDVDDKHKKGALTLRQRIGPNRLYPNKLYRQLTSIPESSEPMPEPAQIKDTIETGQSSHDTKIVTDDVDKTITELPSSDAPNLVGVGSNAKEIKEGDSEFQQKTMSVMRGGELVQVNYKVYIPKNARALARRKLKR